MRVSSEIGLLLDGTLTRSQDDRSLQRRRDRGPYLQ